MRARTSVRRVPATVSRVSVLLATAMLVSLALPAAVGNAASAGAPQSLQQMVDEANNLSNQIDTLSQQYDGLQIELTEARAEAAVAKQMERRDEQALGAGQVQLGQIAAEGYMMGGLSPTVQLLQTPNPQQFLDRASIMLELQYQQGGTMSLLQSAEGAADRAKETALQEQSQAATLAAAMNKKVGQIQAKENLLNSAAFSRALQVFQETGSYPNIQISGDTLGEQALRWALTRLGDMYAWGGAGPDEFDCSGLVMWAYAHVGISLMHYTGDQWLEGEHISRSQLEPGDLVFFFADISHVGMYIGNGMMVDAPTFGQPVQVQPVMWNVYVGAVRIVA
jgi:peptidoglycan DL-endopeptidase CwlO